MRLVRVRTRVLFSPGVFSAGAFACDADLRAGRSDVGDDLVADLGADSTFLAATIRPDEPAGICIASKK